MLLVGSEVLLDGFEVHCSMCGSVLQCVTSSCNALRCVALLLVGSEVLLDGCIVRCGIFCSVLQCVASCCSVLQYVSSHESALPCLAA